MSNNYWENRKKELDDWSDAMANLMPGQIIPMPPESIREHFITQHDLVAMQNQAASQSAQMQQTATEVALRQQQQMLHQQAVAQGKTIKIRRPVLPMENTPSFDGSLLREILRVDVVGACGKEVVAFRAPENAEARAALVSLKNAEARFTIVTRNTDAESLLEGEKLLATFVNGELQATGIGLGEHQKAVNTCRISLAESLRDTSGMDQAASLNHAAIFGARMAGKTEAMAADIFAKAVLDEASKVAAPQKINETLEKIRRLIPNRLGMW
jgi:hypothetical protein